MLTNVFVYGTLRSPAEGIEAADTHYHHRIADHIVERATGTISDAELFDCGPYPALRAGAGVVVGEVFAITEDGLAIADVIEGHPDFYERATVRVTVTQAPSGSSFADTVEAWTYWAPDLVMSTAYPVPSGDWFHRDRGQLPPNDFAPQDPELAASLERLASSRESWVSTVSPDGRPHLVPMWHVERGGRFYMATDATSVKMQNLAENPSMVIAHPDPNHVVYAHGWAIERNDVGSSVAPLFVDKYEWDPTNDEGVSIIEVSLISLTSWGPNEEPRQHWRM